jgi:hypothetical protein
MPKIVHRPNGLTLKQTKVIQGIVQGKSGADVGMEVYNTKTRNGARSMVSATLARPNVQDALALALKQKGLDLTSITREVGTIASHEVDKITGDTKLKALIELLKLHRAYPDKRTAHLNVNVNAKIKDMTYSDAKKELERMNDEGSSIVEDVS